jgi:hypothetical protein
MRLENQAMRTVAGIAGRLRWVQGRRVRLIKLRRGPTSEQVNNVVAAVAMVKLTLILMV